MHLHIETNTADKGKLLRSHNVKYSVKWWSFAVCKTYEKTNTALVSGSWKGLCKSETYRFSPLNHNKFDSSSTLSESALHLCTYWKNTSWETSLALNNAKKFCLSALFRLSKSYLGTHATVKLVQLPTSSLKVSP